MSIDARVAGIRKSEDQQVKLTLEDRPRGGPAGQPTLVILNVPNNWESSPLVDLVGCDIWGNASQIMLCNSVFATRDGYQGITLAEGWDKAIAEYHQQRRELAELEKITPDDI